VNSTDLKSTLLAGLLELEQSGDIVITNPAPQVLADQLSTKLIDQWGRQSLDVPIEAVIDTGMKSAATALVKIFNLGSAEATSAVERFVRSLGESREPKEVAELISHQGAQEIAYGAFFCSHLRQGKYYSSDYLDWRKSEYARQRSK
jgi:hypothetical protein